MWQPPRFSRLPSDEPREGQPIQMAALPADQKIDSKADIRSDYQSDYHPVGLDSGYDAGAQNNATYAGSYQHSLSHGSRKEEPRGFKNKFIKTFYGGWRAGLMRSFLFCLLALIANIAIYAYLFGTYNTTAGTATIRSGDCTMIRNSNTAIHAALNIVSTLILGASTYAMQGMTAPTRKEVDAAHEKGKWVEIGTQSVRNLFYVRRRNLWVWLLLGITSLPYHLFFNAVFFTTTQNNQYAMALVDQSILRSSDFQPTLENASPDLFEQFTYHDKDCENTLCRFNNSNDAAVFDLLRDITNSSDSGHIDFMRMEPQECIQNYSTGFLREWGDVAVVTSQAGGQSPVLFTRYPERTITLNKEETNQDPFHWICNDVMSANNTYGDEICSLELALTKFDSGRNWTVYGHPVSHCLARYLPSQCELQFNAWLMLGIVVFGIIKSIVIAFILIARTSGTSMHTLGDAIASFLERPDSTTKGMCLITSSQIRKHGFHPPYPPQPYIATRPRWLSSANTLEFISTISISAIYIIVLATALYFGIEGARGSAFTNGLGAPDIQSLARFQPDDTGSSGIVPTLLIANIPQLGFSILYVVYYSIWGKLLVAHEFDRLTRARKSVRVSERKGAQRSTRFFTLPVRYAAPLMACSAGLHWLCSQSFFMVRIDGVDGRGAIDPNDRLVRLGYSSRGVVSLVALSVAMLAGTVCVCVLRTMNTGLGETSMSVILSAACHPIVREGKAWEEPVQWGDVGLVGSVDGGGVIRRVAFSNGPVERPREGELYG